MLAQRVYTSMAALDKAFQPDALFPHVVSSGHADIWEYHKPASAGATSPLANGRRSC